jgi:hypothetical protein
MVVMVHNAVWGKFNPKQSYLPFIAQVRKVKSPADLLTENVTDDFVKVEVPEMACLYGDDGQFGCGAIDHGLIELENGNLLLTMYGVFKSDNIPVPYFTQPSFQNRVWICRSKDNGSSWQYLSTIASLSEFTLPPLAEGFNEADLIKTDDSGLLSVMRTGGNPAGKGTERFTPIYACTSTDSGVTWSRPWEVYPFGVWPKLAKMSDGTLVCSSGRPGVFFLVSTDNGTSWSPPHVITDHYAGWRMCPSGLTSLGEIEPGKLVIFYDDVIVHKDGRVSHPTKMRVYQISG